MTAQPQAQPMPGAVPASLTAQPQGGVVQGQPPTEASARRTRSAGRTPMTVFGVSLLVATAGVSFALGRMTAEESTPTTAGPFAGGAMPMAVAEGATEVASTTDATGIEVSALDSSDPGAGGSGTAAVAAFGTDTEADASVTSDQGQGTAPAGPPDGAMGGRPAMGGMAGGTDGTVAEITDSSLTITTTDGSERTFAIDGTTSWVQQAAIDASAVQAGDSVTVEIPFGPGTADSDSTVVTQVVVTTTGA